MPCTIILKVTSLASAKRTDSIVVCMVQVDQVGIVDVNILYFMNPRQLLKDVMDKVRIIFIFKV